MLLRKLLDLKYNKMTSKIIDFDNIKKPSNGLAKIAHRISKSYSSIGTIIVTVNLNGNIMIGYDGGLYGEELREALATAIHYSFRD